MEGSYALGVQHRSSFYLAESCCSDFFSMICNGFEPQFTSACVRILNDVLSVNQWPWKINSLILEATQTRHQAYYAGTFTINEALIVASSFL
jgi:hypothetical protein